MLELLAGLRERIIYMAKRLDPILIFLVLSLYAISIYYLRDIGLQVGGTIEDNWFKQCVWVCIGIGVMGVMSLWDYEFYIKRWWLFYGLGMGLLLAVILVGKEINGAKSWIDLGFFDLQPAELAKPAAILGMSWCAGLPMRQIGGGLREIISHIIPVIILGFIPFALIMLQPDLGSASVFIPTTVAILFVAGLKKRYIITPVLLLVLMSPLVYMKIADHQRKRIDVFLQPISHPIAIDKSFEELKKYPELKKEIAKRIPLMRNPWQYTLNEIDRVEGNISKKVYKKRRYAQKTLNHYYVNEAWQSRQSELCVSSGGLMGKGSLGSVQLQFGFLYDKIAISDCLFSIIAEQGGFIMGGLVVFLLTAISLRCLFIAYRAKDNYGRCIAAGIGMMFVYHTYVNVGMAMNIAPVIGIPLPFLSYGGSFVIATMVSIGLMQSVYAHSANDENQEKIKGLS